MKIEDNFYPSCNFNATRGRMLHKKLVMRFHVKLPQISLIGCLCLFYTIFFFKIDLIQWSLKYSRHLHLLVLRRMSKSSTNTLKSWEFGWYCFDANLIVSSTWCKVIDTWLSLQRLLRRHSHFNNLLKIFFQKLFFRWCTVHTYILKKTLNVRSA